MGPCRVKVLLLVVLGWMVIDFLVLFLFDRRRGQDEL